VSDDLRAIIERARMFMELNAPEIELDIQQLLAELADALEDMLPVEQPGVCYCEEETEDRWLWDEERHRWRLEGSWNTSFILPEDLPRFCFNCGARLDASGVASRSVCP